MSSLYVKHYGRIGKKYPINFTYTWLIEILRHAADCLRLDAEPRKHKKLGYLAMSAETWWYLLLFSGLLNFHLLGYPLGSLYRNEKWIKNSTSYYVCTIYIQVALTLCDFDFFGKLAQSEDRTMWNKLELL